MIDVVDENAIGYFHNLPVHPDNLAMCSSHNGPPGIVSTFATNSVPFMRVYPLVIFGVHYGVFTLRQSYPPKAIPIADAAIQKRKENRRLFNPCWNVQNYFNNRDLPYVEIRSKFKLGKFKIQN